ncbi:MAG: hypothetical protein J6P44_05800 [Bacteroidales bacterium]|nr:hypothetical protein [Bacteroidales bacterium]
MKKIFCFISAICSMFFMLTAYSQPTKVEWEALHNKMMKQKYEFLKKELALDEMQMKKFWDVYTQYDEEICVCHERACELQDKITKNSADRGKRLDEELLTDEQAMQLNSQRMITERQLLEVEEKYTAEFNKVLSPQKVLKLNRLEKQFMREIMSKGHKDIKKENDKR